MTGLSNIPRTDLDESPWQPYLHGVPVNGSRVWYLDAGTGPAIVLLHGAGATWRVWLANFGDLTRDHRVIAVDIPGFGDSAKMPWSRNLDPYAEVVVGLLDRLDVGPVTVVGHSLGGLVAQRVAARLGSRCSGLVLVTALGLGLTRAHRLALVAGISLFRLLVCSSAVLGALTRFPATVGPLVASLAHDPARFPRQLVVPLLRGFPAATGWWRAMAAAIFDRFPSGSAVADCPKLLLWGESDRLAPLATGRALAAAMPGAVFECWPEVAHSMMIEKPVEFDARLRRFVRETTASDARADIWPGTESGASR